MNSFERDIIFWVFDAYPCEREALSSQLLGSQVIRRDFTNGAGAFVVFQPNDNSVVVRSGFLNGLTRINGPEVRSSEPELGATVDIEFNSVGIADYFEIWAMAGDYPPDRHPYSYTFKKLINHRLTDGFCVAWSLCTRTTRLSPACLTTSRISKHSDRPHHSIQMFTMQPVN